MSSRLRLAMVAVAAAVILPAATAQAATRTVVAGPLKPVKGAFGGHASGDVDGFSLKTVTIHIGDKVRWKFNGFHNVVFPKKGGGDVPFLMNDPTSTKYSGLNDAAGSPFWFNGQRRVVVNPLAAFPQGGKTENGSQVTGSGLPLGGTPKPYTLTFTKAGIFRYECTVHPGMEGAVKVVSKRKRIPSAAQNRRAEVKLLAREARAAKRQLKLKLPRNTLQGGNDKGSVVQLRFFPQTIHVRAGTTLTMRVKSLPEAHTFTFGPSKYVQDLANNFVVPAPGAGGPPTLVFNGQVGFPSDPPPAGVPAVDGTNHGNGFVSTGVLDGDPHSPQPSSAKIKFTKAGTYQYICLLHPFMHGKVVVR